MSDTTRTQDRTDKNDNDTLFPPQSEVSPKAKCKMLPSNYELTSPNIHPIWPQGGFAPSIRIRTDVKLRLEENCVKQGDVTVKLRGPLVQTTNDTGQGMHNNQLLLLDFLGGSEDTTFTLRSFPRWRAAHKQKSKVERDQPDVSLQL